MTPDAKDNATVPTEPAVCADGPGHDPEPDCDSLRARSKNLNSIPYQGRTEARVQSPKILKLYVLTVGYVPEVRTPESALTPCLLVFTVTSDTHGFITHSLTLKTHFQ